MLSARRPALAASGLIGAGDRQALDRASTSAGSSRVADRRAQSLRARGRSRRDRRRGRSRGRCRLRSAAPARARRRPARASCRRAMRAERRHQPVVDRAARLPARSAATLSISKRIGKRLHRLPAVERIAVVRGEEAQIVVRRDRLTSLIGAEKPRLSERTGRSAMPVNTKLSAGCVSTSTPRSSGRRRRVQRQIAAVRADQAERERDHHRLLARLAGRRRHGLLADRARRSWRAAS